MKASVKFEVLDARSSPGKLVNEDCLGHTAHRLWMVDGATGIASSKCTTGFSDAAWLSQCISEALAAMPQDLRSSEDTLERLSSQVTRTFAQEINALGLPAVADEDCPCACLGLVELRDNRLDMACIGDITIVVKTADGLQIFSDQSVQPFSDRTLAHWRTLHAQGLPPEEIWNQLLSTLRSNRQAVNRPDGYGVVHPTRSWLHKVVWTSLPAKPGMQILMVTDGFWRLVDTFKCFTPQTLMGHLELQDPPKLSPAMAMLREIEMQDSGNDLFDRIKTHDDASALYASVAGAPA
jgi:hypothetical protein